MKFKCKYPPVYNAYYKHYRNRVVLSPKAKEYHLHMIEVLGGVKSINKEVLVEINIKIYPPDRRRRDVDNVLKCLFDSITRSKYWDDDSQVKRLIIERMDVVKGGLCEIEIKEIS